MSDRRLCPHCRGMNDECPFCDGGWLITGETLESSDIPPPKAVIVDSQSVRAQELKFNPRSRHIVLGENTNGVIADIDLLKLANREVSLIDKARGISTEHYAKVARSAFMAIKALLERYKGEALKSRLQKILNTAYFHMKNAQAMMPANPRANSGHVIQRARNANKNLNQVNHVNTIMRERLLGAGVTISHQMNNATSGKPVVSKTSSNKTHQADKKATTTKASKSAKGKRRKKIDIYTAGKRLSGSGFSKS